MYNIVRQWELETGLEMEETNYSAIYSRDVNNYLAFKTNGEVKRKGIFTKTDVKKNPVNQICTEAIVNHIQHGMSISETIRACRNIADFVTVRRVVGGAVKDGQYLGKIVRWYYAIGIEGEIVYAKNGNKVPRTETAKPIMTFPSEFPNDINYEWYEQETLKILTEIGYLKGEVKSADKSANESLE